MTKQEQLKELSAHWGDGLPSCVIRQAQLDGRVATLYGPCNEEPHAQAIAACRPTAYTVVWGPFEERQSWDLCHPGVQVPVLRFVVGEVNSNVLAEANAAFDLADAWVRGVAEVGATE